ncbi:hypothetical protein BB560_002086 [Smittium megazygosporum]|nr:hypothetical protein BB560_002086 [Smittium megazygosporum]
MGNSIGKFVRASKSNVESHLETASIPTLAIYGDKDPDFSDVPAEKDLIQSKLKNSVHAESFILKEVGHYPHVEAFEDTQPLIESFLTKILN